MKIKGFDKDLKCRGYQFEVGKIYEIKLPDGYELTEDDLCSDKVFHYCNSLKDVHEYYSVDPNEHNRFCEIEVCGKEVTDGNKCGSNKIKIIREIVGKELNILRGLINGNTGLFNSGSYDSGSYNSGDFNSGYYNGGNDNSGQYNSGNGNSGNRNNGHYNSGNRNSGHHNSGHGNSGNNNSGHYNSGWTNSGNHNSGHCNSGYFNSGYGNSGHGNSGNNNSGNHNSGGHNSGSHNSGDFNSGYHNSGHFNSGNFNSCDYSSGLFCTQNPKVKIFDTETDMTMEEVVRTDWYHMLFKHSFDLTEWIGYTNEKKQSNKDKKRVEGYLKTYSYKEACKNWWNKYTDEEKAVIMSMPNFDKEKFKQITGIKV